MSCDEALREDISERENSPTYLLWQRKQQGTPGFRSEVSSLVESGQWTEDGNFFHNKFFFDFITCTVKFHDMYFNPSISCIK